MNKVSEDQLEELIAHMEDHTLFARAQVTKLGGLGHDKYKNMWIVLTDKLNAKDGAHKTPAQWEETWTNLKLKAKKNTAQYLTALKETGNNDVIPVSEADQRISNIFGKYGTGLPIIEEIGINLPKKNPIYYLDNHDDYDDDDDDDEDDYSSAYVDKNDSYRSSICDDLEVIKLNSKETDRSRPSPEQLSLLLRFMEKHPEFALGGIEEDLAESQWDDLADNLNSLHKNREFRSVDQWKRTWSDQVSAARRKKLDFINRRPKVVLTDNDQQILRAIREPIPAEHERVELEPSSSKRSGNFNETSLSKRPALDSHAILTDHTSKVETALLSINQTLMERNQILSEGLAIEKERNEILREELSTMNAYLRDGVSKVHELQGLVFCTATPNENGNKENL